jgi:predicted nucleic acid-binding protein
VKLADGLRGVTLLGLDTPPLIYLVESHPRYDPLVVEIFRQIEASRVGGVTSVVSLGEVLVQPIRDRNTTLRRQYRELLLERPGLRTVSINPAVAERAADLRARYGFRLPDALQLAVAIEERCEAFLTNDRRLARVTETRVLVLDDLEL